jgi:[acyl-carrier-protein] S-malonyltransferase
MAKAAAAFRRALEETTIRSPRMPFVANGTASPLTDPNQIREALGRQLTSPVHWTESVRWMIRQGATRFVEVGPGEVLTGLLRRIDRGVDRKTTAQVLGLGDET